MPRRFLLKILAILVLLGAAPAVADDLTLGFSTYIGGNSDLSVREIGFDQAGNAVIATYGSFLSAAFPGSTVFGSLGTGSNDNIAVLKFDPAGVLLWSTLIGGSGKERAYGLEIDMAGDIYIAGSSSSSDLPTTPGAFDETFNGGDPNPVHGPRDCYALKLSGDGGSLIYCTYLGGAKTEAARGGLALGSDGSVFVVGYTRSPDYLGPIPQHINSFAGSVTDAIITKLSPDGSSIIYNRFIGSAGFDIEEVIAGARVDSAGRLHFCAIVRSPGAPTTDGSVYHGGEADLYVGRLSPDGVTLEYASYFGGSGAEFMEHRLALDAAGNIYVCGATTSTDLPTQGPGQLVHGGGEDAFLIKFDTNGQMVWSTYVGGSGNDSVFGPVFDSTGRVWIGGYTESANFFTTPDAYDSSLAGPRDATLRRYATDGTLEYSSLIGGTGVDYGRYISLDPAGRIYLCGETDSPDFPTTPGAFQENYIGGSNAFFTQFLVAIPCLPDVNGDGMLTPADFTAWIAAFNAVAPECDQNGDGSCTPADFTSWIANFNAGC